MDFAKGLLIKYGWKEGQGIGKNENGIVIPVKANLKFDHAGLSYDKATEFTDHWWRKTFDEAANNLNANGSSISVNESKEIVSQNLNSKNYEGYFQKESFEFQHDYRTGENDDQISHLFEPVKDEDLLEACGGRTAHKGARHGLSLKGKLSRIVAQEEQLLEENILDTENAQSIFQTWIQVKKKKFKDGISKKKKMYNGNVENIPNSHDATHSNDVLNGLINQEDYQLNSMSKKKKRRHRNRDEDLAKSLSQLTTAEKQHGVQASSKAIKKEKYRTKLRGVSPRSGEPQKAISSSKERKTKRKNGQTENNLDSFSSCDDGKSDSLVFQIKSLMNQYPSKKFKVEAEKLTPFQRKQLEKSGLRIEMKSKKREKKKRQKERAQVEKIIKKLEKSMVFGDSKI